MGMLDTDETFEPGNGYMNNQMLVAMPNIGDERFDKTVIFICAHSADGAMGIVVNRPAEGISLPSLMEQLGIDKNADYINLPTAARDVAIQFGGPVESNRGFVLHSADYFSENNTMPIDEDIGLTATIDVLRAISHGNGPQRAFLALGYAGWGPGQSESEILSNGWLHCEADNDLIFAQDWDRKYDRALAKIGIDPAFLSSTSGHA